jgi:hypothetical protein
VPVFLRRLLGIGKLPEEMRDSLVAEGIIFEAEYVPVTRRFSGKVPGLRSAGSVAGYVGALVFTGQRAVGTLSSVPKLAGNTLDVRWSDQQQGPVRADISHAGLTLSLDVGKVDPRCSGHLSLTYKCDISDDVLARIPRHHLEFDVPPEYVFRAVGVPYRP